MESSELEGSDSRLPDRVPVNKMRIYNASTGSRLWMESGAKLLFSATLRYNVEGNNGKEEGLIEKKEAQKLSRDWS